MTAESFRWIDTNRLTDAEILSEIAACDLPHMVLSSVNPSRVIDVLGMIPSAHRVLLIEPATPDLTQMATRSWPDRLALLVTPPSSFGVIAVGMFQAASREVTLQSLGDWLILQSDRGAGVNRKKPIADCDFPPLGQSSPQKLVPGNQRPLPGFLCRQISQVADVHLRGNSADISALRAGLFQWHDALDESHECSQSIEGKGRYRAGDYWHAIMHRREPDFGNSKYWFRRVGSHPIFPELARRAEPIITASLPDWQERLLRGGDWDPFAFVDLCEAVVGENRSDRTAAAEAIQEIEMLLLLGSTYQDATTW